MKQKNKNEEVEPRQDLDHPPRSFYSRVLQPVGAVVVTAIAMWYLLGIPASILWEPFYQRLTGLGESQSTEHVVREESP